ncbi:Beta-propeller repeat protein [compost metagenome]
MLLLVPFLSFSQDYQWAGSMGNYEPDFAHSVAVDASGNVYTTGYFELTVDFDPGPGVANLTSNGNRDIFVNKLDANGNHVWTQNFGSTSFDEGYAITVDAAGNVYVTGAFQGTVDFDFGPGIANLTSAGNRDVFICKLDPNGNLMWAKCMGSAGWEESHAIHVDPSGNVYTTGFFAGTVDFDPGPGVANLVTSSGSSNTFISKLDNNGNYVWARQLGGDFGISIATDAAGNVYTAGSFTYASDFDPGPGTAILTPFGSVIRHDLFISKLDINGDYIWAKQIGGPNDDLCRGIAIDAAGNVYFACSFQETADFDPGPGIANLTAITGHDAGIGKLDPDGNYIWAKHMDVFVHAIALDPGRNVYTTGSFGGTATDFDPGAGIVNLNSSTGDVFISKLDSDGNFLKAKNFGRSAVGRAIAVDAAENSYIAGTNRGTADFDPGPGVANLTSKGQEDIFVCKFDRCSNESATETISACNSYTWRNGITYTSSVTNVSYVVSNGSGPGCDSTYFLNLDIRYSNAGTDVITACDSYTWIDGIEYTASNNAATFTIQNAAGCDSIVTLNLTITHSNSGTDILTTCDSYTWIDGIEYTSSNNTATFTLENEAGCDSIVTLNLTITHSNSGTDIITVCDSYTWIDGIEYTASNNTATFTLENAAGCDSIVTLNLTITHSNSGTDIVTACDSYTWIDGIEYTASNNTATFTLENATGCDSIVTLNLTITHSNSGTDIVTACDSYTWIDGIEYTASNNTATFTLQNAADCDSIVTLNLTIAHSNSGTDIVTACDSYTWIDGIEYTSSNNTATFTLENAAGCDSVVTLNLTINSVAVSTSISGITITANEPGATYQWINCAGNIPVSGAVNQSFTPTANGNYAVVIDNGNCSDTSACVNINSVGIDDYVLQNWDIFPNPTSGEVTVIFEGINGVLVIRDAAGKLVWGGEILQNSTVSLNDYQRGVYFFELKTATQMGIKRVVKN